MFDLYQEQILERYKNPQFAGLLDQADFSSEGSNPLCGDEIRWEIKQDQQGRLSELGHQTRACAICTASADLLAEQLIGKTATDLALFGATQVTELIGIPLSPTRLKCALLPLETLKQALEKTKI